jgi:hypothetical protein
MKCIIRSDNFFSRAVIALSLMINLSEARRLGIVGGKAESISNVPYQAAYLVNGRLKCGASIISDNCALTAGNNKRKKLSIDF